MGGIKSTYSENYVNAKNNSVGCPLNIPSCYNACDDLFGDLYHGDKIHILSAIPLFPFFTNISHKTIVHYR